jgi:3-methyladenine DNA glycosylase AlkD
MKNHHQDILAMIHQHSGKPTQHTFLDSYLGNSNPRHAISAPVLRKIAKDWMKEHASLSTREFEKLIGDLIQGESSTEKYMAGVLLDYSSAEQRKFNPESFDRWLDHLTGWAEVDAVCSGRFTVLAIPEKPKPWKKLVTRLSKSKNINKRRASLVFLCGPVRTWTDVELAELALANVEKLKHEKEILITKAISWLLRSMVKQHKKLVQQYVQKNQKSLPAIAVRETLTKLKTGRKNG